MEVFFVYGLLLLFALGVIVMVFIVLSDPNKAGSLEQQAKTTIPRTQPDKLAYGLLSALIAFFCVLTFLSQRKNV